MPSSKIVPPVSARRRSSEIAYGSDKAAKKLRPLNEETLIDEWKYWSLIDNRYPYDMLYQVSHMLIPKRQVAEYDDLNWREKRELRKIISTHCTGRYDQVVENLGARRSVAVLFHLHLLKFVDDRRAVRL